MSSPMQKERENPNKDNGGLIYQNLRKLITVIVSLNCEI